MVYDPITDLKEKCVVQLKSGLTKDLESMYILAYAALSIVERLDRHTEHQEQAQQEAAKQTKMAEAKARASRY